jgi:hypothetical protein
MLLQVEFRRHVPDTEQRLRRTVMRLKYQVIRNRVQLQNRLEALLEEAHIKVSSIVSCAHPGNDWPLVAPPFLAPAEDHQSTNITSTGNHEPRSPLGHLAHSRPPTTSPLPAPSCEPLAQTVKIAISGEFLHSPI